jgi:hypothetical protein
VKCDRCNRYLRKPGVDVVVYGKPFVFGPVCAQKVAGKTRPTASKRSTRARRVDQRDLFVEAGL